MALLCWPLAARQLAQWQCCSIHLWRSPVAFLVTRNDRWKAPMVQHCCIMAMVQQLRWWDGNCCNGVPMAMVQHCNSLATAMVRRRRCDCCSAATSMVQQWQLQCDGVVMRLRQLQWCYDDDDTMARQCQQQSNGEVCLTMATPADDGTAMAILTINQHLKI